MKILFLITPGNGSATLGHVNLTIITPKKKITLTQKKNNNNKNNGEYKNKLANNKR